MTENKVINEIYRCVSVNVHDYINDVYNRILNNTDHNTDHNNKIKDLDYIIKRHIKNSKCNNKDEIYKLFTNDNGLYDVLYKYIDIILTYMKYKKVEITDPENYDKYYKDFEVYIKNTPSNYYEEFILHVFFSPFHEIKTMESGITEFVNNFNIDVISINSIKCVINILRLLNTVYNFDTNTYHVNNEKNSEALMDSNACKMCLIINDDKVFTDLVFDLLELKMVLRAHLKLNMCFDNILLNIDSRLNDNLFNLLSDIATNNLNKISDMASDFITDFINYYIRTFQGTLSLFQKTYAKYDHNSIISKLTKASQNVNDYLNGWNQSASDGLSYKYTYLLTLLFSFDPIVIKSYELEKFYILYCHNYNIIIMSENHKHIIKKVLEKNVLIRYDKSNYNIFLEYVSNYIIKFVNDNIKLFETHKLSVLLEKIHGIIQLSRYVLDIKEVIEIMTFSPCIVETDNLYDRISLIYATFTEMATSIIRHPYLPVTDRVLNHLDSELLNSIIIKGTTIDLIKNVKLFINYINETKIIINKYIKYTNDNGVYILCKYMFVEYIKAIDIIIERVFKLPKSLFIFIINMYQDKDKSYKLRLLGKLSPNSEIFYNMLNLLEISKINYYKLSQYIIDIERYLKLNENISEIYCSDTMMYLFNVFNICSIIEEDTVREYAITKIVPIINVKDGLSSDKKHYLLFYYYANELILNKFRSHSESKFGSVEFYIFDCVVNFYNSPAIEYQVKKKIDIGSVIDTLYSMYNDNNCINANEITNLTLTDITLLYAYLKNTYRYDTNVNVYSELYVKMFNYKDDSIDSKFNNNVSVLYLAYESFSQIIDQYSTAITTLVASTSFIHIMQACFFSNSFLDSLHKLFYADREFEVVCLLYYTLVPSMKQFIPVNGCFSKAGYDSASYDHSVICDELLKVEGFKILKKVVINVCFNWECSNLSFVDKRSHISQIDINSLWNLNTLNSLFRFVININNVCEGREQVTQNLISSFAQILDKIDFKHHVSIYQFVREIVRALLKLNSYETIIFILNMALESYNTYTVRIIVDAFKDEVSSVLQTVTISKTDIDVVIRDTSQLEKISRLAHTIRSHEYMLHQPMTLLNRLLYISTFGFAVDLKPDLTEVVCKHAKNKDNITPFMNKLNAVIDDVNKDTLLRDAVNLIPDDRFLIFCIKCAFETKQVLDGFAKKVYTNTKINEILVMCSELSSIDVFRELTSPLYEKKCPVVATLVSLVGLITSAVYHIVHINVSPLSTVNEDVAYDESNMDKLYKAVIIMNENMTKVTSSIKMVHAKKLLSYAVFESKFYHIDDIINTLDLFNMYTHEVDKEIYILARILFEINK